MELTNQANQANHGNHGKQVGVGHKVIGAGGTLKIRCAFCGMGITSLMLDRLTALGDVMRKLTLHLERNHQTEMVELTKDAASLLNLMNTVMTWMRAVDVPDDEMDNPRMKWVQEYVEDQTIELIEVLGIGDPEILRGLAEEFEEEEEEEEDAGEDEETKQEGASASIDKNVADEVNEATAKYLGISEKSDKSGNETILAPVESTQLEEG